MELHIFYGTDQYKNRKAHVFIEEDEYNFMICHKIGFPPISIIGFGFMLVSSLILVPNPPASMNTFILVFS